MPEQIVNPNLHVILIHFPIAMLFAGTAIEVFAFLWRRSTFRLAGRWMILIGALMTIPAVTTGMYAARQAMDSDGDATLSDLKQHAHLDDAQWDLLRNHIKLNGAATGLLAVLVVVWLGSSDRFRQRAHFLFLLLLVGAVSLIAAGAWHGGELTYSHATGVNLVKGGFPPAPEANAGKRFTDSRAKAQWAFDALNAGNDQLSRVDAVMDIHAVLAGVTIALALAMLGISLRTMTLVTEELHGDYNAASDDEIFKALSGTSQQQAQVNQQLAAPLPTPEVVATRYIPPARFWLLAALAALSAIVLGWMLAGPGSYNDAVEMLKGELRTRAHTILAASILLLTLLLALVTRFAPRNRMIVGCFALLLTLALAAQLWMGILLLFDTSSGPLNHFNAPTTQSSLT